MDEPRKVTLELPAELDRQVDTLAGEQHRPKSALVEEALRNYLELQAWQISAIKEGIADIERGDVVDHAEVKAWIAGLRRKRIKKTATK